MNQISARILLLLFFFPSLAVATNFGQCLEDLRNDPDAVGGVDSWGNPTSPAAAVGFTYKTCTERCGSSPVPFSWEDFSQLFPSWLLPWLALISQLPFGSGNYLDDFASSEPSFRFVTSPIAYQNALYAPPVVMSVGSPALAAYSLILTALNARSVYRRVERIKYRNKAAVARALISLQQLPLELTKKDIFLASISINSQWEQVIVSRLNRRNTWSLATASSVAWVIIAFLFTLINSFLSLNNLYNSPDDSTASKSASNAIGTLWLWLLCLVIGWMWVPTFTCGELKSALRHANQKAAKNVTKRIRRARRRACQARNPTKTKVTDEPLEMNVLRGSGEHNIEVVEEGEKVKEGSVHEVGRHAGQEADQKADPLPNMTAGPSRLVSEDQRNHDNLNDSETQTSSQNSPSRVRPAGVTHSWIQLAMGELLVSKDSGSLNRDESRCAATFNYARVIRYLALVEDVSRMFDKPSQDNDAVGVSWKCQTANVGLGILSGRGGPSLGRFLCFHPQRALCSLQEHSSRCWARRFSALFYNAE